MTNKLRLLWAALKPGARVDAPRYAGDAGFDLTITEDVELLPNQVSNVPCSSRIALPRGFCSLVIGRSSMARAGVHIYATLIDEKYHGPLFVLAQRIGSDPITVHAGERIAQLLLVRIPPPIDVVQVDENDLPQSERGSKGFGSTGR